MATAVCPVQDDRYDAGRLVADIADDMVPTARAEEEATKRNPDAVRFRPMVGSDISERTQKSLRESRKYRYVTRPVTSVFAKAAR
jgi:hypothetical protein